MGTAADIQLLNGTKLFYQVICYYLYVMEVYWSL